jgi:hypothetical protein
MATFRSHLDLIPDQILGIDELVAAHLEWLLAEKLHPGLAQRWWADHKGLERHPLDLWPVAVEHLGSRRPPTGTEQWGRDSADHASRSIHGHSRRARLP